MGANPFSQDSSFNIVDKHIRSLIEQYMIEFEKRLTSGGIQIGGQKDDIIRAIGEYIEGTPIIHYLVQQNLELAKRLEDVENKTFSRTATPALTTSIEDDRRARIKEKIRNG